MEVVPPPLLFACGSLLLQGIFEVLYQLAHRGGLDESTYMVAQTGAVFTTLTVISGSALGFELTAQMALLGVVSGLLGMTTGWTHLYAMGRGPGSVTSAVRKLSFILTGLLAVVFLGESLTLTKLAAGALAALALVTMGLRGDNLTRPHPVIYVALVTSGLMAFVHKLAAMAGVSASAFLMVQSGTAHVSSHVVALRRGGYRFSRNTVGFALLTGSIIAVAMVLGMYALRAGEAVVVVPILQLGFLVNAPLSFWLLKEPVTGRKLLGLLMGTLAIVAFAMELG
ncbi:MAG: EamA family transporter [Myxococcales bacterium]|jgi:transporter family protein